ncbi:MAG: hypothetical protein AAF492_13670, partial [Verrucomicrobiota bacterium]
MLAKPGSPRCAGSENGPGENPLKVRFFAGGMFLNFMNMFLIIIIFLLVGEYVLNLVVEILNLKHLKTEIPDEFKDTWDADKYQQSQLYLKDNTKFEFVSSTISIAVTLAFILLGGFNWVNPIQSGAAILPIVE